MNPEMSDLLQYVLVGVLVLLALIFLINLIRKNFSPKKFTSKEDGCGSNCGCQK